MPTTTRPATLTGLLLIVLAGLSASYVGIARGQETGSPGVAMPVYDDQGHLRLPPNYREWVFIGSSLGMSYSEGAMSHEMFHETLMEPGAYRHFVETGEFAEGTQFVLLLHGTGESVLPMRQGRFAAEASASSGNWIPPSPARYSSSSLRESLSNWLATRSSTSATSASSSSSGIGR